MVKPASSSPLTGVIPRSRRSCLPASSAKRSSSPLLEKIIATSQPSRRHSLSWRWKFSRRNSSSTKSPASNEPSGLPCVAKVKSSSPPSAAFPSTIRTSAPAKSESMASNRSPGRRYSATVASVAGSESSNSACSSLLVDACESRSNSRSDSRSVSKNSNRSGRAACQANRSIIPPRTANCPRELTVGTRS